MRIVEIRERTVPLRATGANAVVDFSKHTVSLVAIVTDVVRDGRPLAGVAFDSIGRFAQGGILRDRMIPRLLAADPDSLLDDAGVIDPARVLREAMRDEKPGGHGDRAAAAAALELACWDLRAKHAGLPAHAVIAEHVGRPVRADGVEVYAAGGYYYPDDSTGRLLDEVRAYRDAGYRSVKIKIGGASLDADLDRVDAVVAEFGSGSAVAVDANGRFDRDAALTYAEACADRGLRWYEEPVDPLDFAALRDVAAAYPGSLATGENLFSARDVVNLLAYGGLRPDRDILQMDAGLSYGLAEYAAMLEAARAAGFDRRSARPHGGHLINLHIVAGLGLGGCEAYPGVFAPFGGYGTDCRIDDGLLYPGDGPGFGLEAKPDLAVEIKELLA